ncbi:CHASE2 domain-containing protein [Cupriavidus plantarum]|uniref:CHASE2 domain-containing protein n=1 Tax=Cupriavidus plantarum TaxID=942865 RepID=UPI00339D9147
MVDSSLARQQWSHLFWGYRKRTLVEWSVLFVLLATAIAASISYQWTGRASVAAYDFTLSAQHRAVRKDIVMVLIDDDSLKEIGRWPWRRSQIAKLVDKIADSSPSVLGLDIVFAEPDHSHPEDDGALARSLARAPRIVIPALPQATESGLRFRYPISELPAEVGHVNVRPDSDGVVRRLNLREGPPGAQLDHLVLRMFSPKVESGGRASHAYAAPSLSEGGGRRQLDPYRIPFVGAAGSFHSVSAVNVLASRTDPALFAGKIVLVGVTGTGLGNVFSVPGDRDVKGMNGVEIMANIAQSLLEHRNIEDVDVRLHTAIGVSILFFVGVATLAFSPRAGLVSVITVCAGTCALSMFLMGTGRVWFDPVPICIGCLLFFPLWSWRRQETTLAFLSTEAARVEKELGTVPQALSASIAPGFGRESLDVRMQAMYRVTSRLRDLRQFLADGIAGLPDATLICDLEGCVVLANRKCHALAPKSLQASHDNSSADLQSVLSEAFISPRRAEEYIADVCCRCRSLLTLNAVLPDFEAIEMKTHGGRPIQVRAAALRTGDGDIAGLALSFVDISEARAAERRREETLRFISHDMRSPQASILALVELQRDTTRALPNEALLERIQHFASRTLDLADDFITLARAESHNLRFAEADLASLVMDAADELWPVADSRSIELVLRMPEEELIAHVEPTLVMRAVANLIENAIKFSVDGAAVTISVYREGPQGTIAVSDHGPGISLADQATLFQPFSMLAGDGARGFRGTGLGLVFVRTVVERLGGTASVRSTPGAGATFLMSLPLSRGAPAPEPAATYKENILSD